MQKINKDQRQKQLVTMLKEDPFYTDEELASYFNVSIQTIRLDRLKLAIPELRERIKDVAQSNVSKVKNLLDKEVIGEILDLEVGNIGISILETTKNMGYAKSKFVKGHFVFGQAESLAIAVVDSPKVLMSVANIKYLLPVSVGDRLIAKAEITRKKDDRFYVHVKINNKHHEQVFRGKYIFDKV